MPYGPTPTITQSLATNEFPLSEVYTPEDGINLVQGGPSSTDSLNSKKSAPVAFYVKDGNDVTQGTSTDANTANTVMGRLTKIRDLLAATLTVQGTITEANSASILADLTTLAGAISTGRMLITPPANTAVNVDQVNGTTLSITNPLLSQHPKTAQVFAGNTYSMTSSKFFSSAGNNGFTMFNNSTAKTIVIRSIQAFDATNPPYFHLMKITSYTAFSDAITPVNHLFNGAASAIADHCSASINSAFSTVTGTEMRCLSQLTSGTLEMLNDGSPVILPAGVASGIVLYTNTGAGGNNLGFTVEWDER